MMTWLMSKMWSPTAPPPLAGLPRKAGATGPTVLPDETLCEGVPAHARPALVVLIGPSNRGLVGAPLLKVEMPEICQPFRSPRVKPLLKALGARSGMG